MMEQACQTGFRCPYRRISEDGDDLCVYPYIRITENEEDNTFGFPDEGDCPLLEPHSELESWLSSRMEDEP